MPIIFAALLVLFLTSPSAAASFLWVDRDGFHSVDQITKVPLEHRKDPKHIFLSGYYKEIPSLNISWMPVKMAINDGDVLSKAFQSFIDLKMEMM